MTNDETMIDQIRRYCQFTGNQEFIVTTETRVKKAIGIADVYTEVSPWRYSAKKKEDGAQIDFYLIEEIIVSICVNLNFPIPNLL